MLAAHPAVVRDRLSSALRSVPDTADLLYLESSLEPCEQRKYSRAHMHWARTEGSASSAAIIFTRKGARRALTLAKQIFMAISDMYTALIRSFLLDAYVIVPLAFFQDSYWGHAVQYHQTTAKTDRSLNNGQDILLHRPFALLCIEQQENELALVVAQTSTQTEFSSRAYAQRMGPVCPVNHSASVYVDSWQAKLLLVSDILSPDGVKQTWTWLEYWTMKSNDDATEEITEQPDVGNWLLVGRWNQSCSLQGIALSIDRRSACFDLLELGQCTIKVKGCSVLGVIENKVVELSSLLHVHKNIFSELDVLNPALRPQNNVSDSFELVTETSHSAVLKVQISESFADSQAEFNGTGIFEINCTKSMQSVQPLREDRIIGSSELGYIGKDVTFSGLASVLNSSVWVETVERGEEQCNGDCQVISAATRIFSEVKDWVILIIFNQAYLPLTQSWLCNTELMPGIWKRILLISTDNHTAAALATWRPGLNVVHWDIGDEYNQKLTFGDIQYFRLMNKRLLLMINILSSGVNFLIAEADALWTSDPLKTLPPDISGNESRPWDIAAAWDFSIYMLGFAFVRATDASIEAYVHVFSTFDALILEYDDDETLTVWDHIHEGFVFRDYIRVHQHEIRVVILDPDLHVGGMWYSDVSSIQTCTVPVTIQNNWLSGNEAKIMRAKQFGHWFFAEEELKCVGNDPLQIVENVFQSLTCRRSPFVGHCGHGCIGTLQNGCKWTRELSNSSLVISVVAGDDVSASRDLSFEIGLAARYGLAVHFIDLECRIQSLFRDAYELLSLSQETNRTTRFDNLQLTEYQELVRASRIQPQQLHHHANCPGSPPQIDFDSESHTSFNTPADKTKQALPIRNIGSSLHQKFINQIMMETEHNHIDILRLDTDISFGNLGINLSTINVDFVVIKNISKDAELSKHFGAGFMMTDFKENNQYMALESLHAERAYKSTFTAQSHCYDQAHLFPIRISFVGHFLNARKTYSREYSIAEPILPYMECSNHELKEPFLVQESNVGWYLFSRWTEHGKGAIAMFTSVDGLKTFSQGQTVLREPWGVGRPFVVKVGNLHYMVTNIEDKIKGPKFLWLYESGPGDWPFRWKRKRRILYEASLLGRPLNPVLFFHSFDSTWYLFVFDEELGRERIFISDRVDAGFLEHPESGTLTWPLHAGPLVKDEDDPNKSIWAFFNSRDERTGRDSIEARRIVKLSRVDFEYSSAMLLLTADGQTDEGWNIRRQSFSAYRVGLRQWIVASDHWLVFSQTEGKKCCQKSGSHCEQCEANMVGNAMLHRAITNSVAGEDIAYPLPSDLPFGIYKSYYINLEHRRDRKLMIESILGNSKIPFERIEAVDGRKTENSHLISGCYDNKYCPGHVGSQHSHMKAIRSAIDSGVDYVAIFEDDFMFKPSVDPEWIHMAVQRVMDLVPDWDVIGLLHNINQKESLDGIQVKWSESFQSEIVRVTEAATATGYIVRGTVLPKLLETFHPSNCKVTLDRSVAIDQCWKGLQKQVMWIGFQPQPGAHNDTYSDIEGWVAKYNLD